MLQHGKGKGVCEVLAVETLHQNVVSRHEHGPTYVEATRIQFGVLLKPIRGSNAAKQSEFAGSNPKFFLPLSDAAEIAL